MAAITSTSLRTAITNRLPSIVNRLDISNVPLNDQLDEAGRAGFRAVFPALYRLAEQTGLTHTEGRVTVTDSTQVIKVLTQLVDFDDFEALVPWTVLTDTVIKVPKELKGTLDVYSIEPYPFPEVGSTTVPDEWVEVIYLATEVALLEQVSADRVTYRGYRPNTEADADTNEILNLLNNKRDRLAQHLQERALQLPPVAL